MNWHKGNIKNNYKKFGANSNGMYNPIKKSPLTDNPSISTEHIEAIKSYIAKYIVDKGRHPTAAHLNKQYGLRATTQFYRGL